MRVLCGPVLGRAHGLEARVLLEVDEAARLSCIARSAVSGVQAAQASVVFEARRPGVFILRDLAPKSTFVYEIATEAGLVLNRGRLRTLPEECAGEDALAMGVVSCNQIFATKELLGEGDVDPWQSLAERVDTGCLDLVIHLGDQVYADHDFYRVKKGKCSRAAFNPRQKALGHYCAYQDGLALVNDLSGPQLLEKEDEICEVYRRVYRDTWGHPTTARVLANVPNLMMGDDHELRDDWGDDPGDLVDSPDVFVVRCGYRVFLEYQHQLFEDADFSVHGPQSLRRDWRKDYFHFRLLGGQLGVMTLDTRMHHCHPLSDSPDGSPLLGDRQWKDIEASLAPAGALGGEQTDLLLVCSPLPVCYLDPQVSAFMAEKLELPDLHGHFATKANAPEQRRLLLRLAAWQAAKPRRKVIILSGDVHAGCETLIEVPAPGAKRQKLWQLLSSPVSNKNLAKWESVLCRTSLRLLGGDGQVVTKSLAGTTEIVDGIKWKHDNFVRARNFGELLVVLREGSEPQAEARLVYGGRAVDLHGPSPDEWPDESSGAPRSGLCSRRNRHSRKIADAPLPGRFPSDALAVQAAEALCHGVTPGQFMRQALPAIVEAMERQLGPTFFPEWWWSTRKILDSNLCFRLDGSHVDLRSAMASLNVTSHTHSSNALSLQGGRFTLLSDVDDTLLPAHDGLDGLLEMVGPQNFTGLNIAGCDRSIPQDGRLYPGVVRFHEVLRGVGPFDYTVLLTARPPPIVSGLQEKLCALTSVGCPRLAILPGVERAIDMMNSIRTIVKGNREEQSLSARLEIFRPLGEQKAGRFREYWPLFPEQVGSYAFLGDDGQGDLVASELMLAEKDAEGKALMAFCAMHAVQPRDDGQCLVPEGEREALVARLRQQFPGFGQGSQAKHRFFYFREYRDLAQQLKDAGWISGAEFGEVAASYEAEVKDLPGVAA